MVNAYEIAVSALLEDNVSNRLRSIVEWADKASASMIDFTESVRKASRATSSLGKSFDRVAAAATALGESNGALTRASYLIDSMAASSADLAKNLAMARMEGGKLGSPTATVIAASPRTSGHAIGTATGVAAGGMLYGVYENARLNDLNVKAVATAQVPFADWQPAIANLREREMAYAGKYAWATGGHIQPFGAAILESSRLMRTLPAAKQKEMMDFGMKYIALEASLKHVPLPEATDSFIGLAHMAGAYDPKQAKPLFESMLQASLTTHASLGQIARAASYALPALHAAGANSSDVMLLITTMMQGGIMNTKSGTWLNAMASNALPNTLGAGMFSNKRQNSALHTLGLYAGNHALFYKNGSMDLMKLVGILAGDREKMEPLKFNALLKMAFGTQGQRAAAFFSEATALGNTHALAALNNFSQPPLDVGRMIQARSSIAAADQAIANFNMTLMNGTDMLLGPVNAALGGANSIFGWTAKYSKDHPIMGGMMDAGMLFGGAVGALGAWKGSKWAVGWTAKAVGSLSKYLAKGSASLIARSASAMTSSEIGSALIASGAADAAAVALSGGIAYLIAHAATSLAAKALPVEQTLHRVTMGTALNELKSDIGLHVTAPPATAGAPQTHVSVHLDGKQIAAHVEKKLVPAKSTGPSGFNGDATPYSPMMGMAP